MMCHRLVILYPKVCAEFYPQFRDESASFRAGNKRIDLLGRRSLASFVPPGYVLLAFGSCFCQCVHDALRGAAFYVGVVSLFAVD